MQYIQVWPNSLEHLTDLKILTLFSSKTWFYVKMFMKPALSTSEPYCCYPLLILKLGLSTFWSSYSSTSLWHQVDIVVPEKLQHCFNTNDIPGLLLWRNMIVWHWEWNRPSSFFCGKWSKYPYDGSILYFLRVYKYLIRFMVILMDNSTKTTET